MNITFDKQADALYIQMGTQQVTNTIPINDRFLIDVDEAGNTVGFEVLDASSQQGLIEDLETHVQHGIPVSLASSETAI